MIVHMMSQRSAEWAQIRLGKLTGSRAADMLATLKKGSGEAASRRNLRVQLTLERITNRSHENGYQSPAMLQGIEREAAALAQYEALTGQLLITPGFLEHDSLAAGCSLDGALDDFSGIVEAKSPIAATHMEYLKTGVVPADYYKQCVHNLWISGAQWCDWFSYQPDFPEPLQTKAVRIHRQQVEMDSYELMVRQFLRSVQEEVDAVQALMSAAV